jgi:hypothetical protein
MFRSPNTTGRLLGEPMKLRTILFALVLGTVGAAHAQDTFSFEKHYKEGDSDQYTMKMKIESQMGELGISMDMKQTVKKVYDNGDADIETQMANMHVVMGGNEMPTGQQAMPATTSKVDKFGKQLTAPQAGRGGMNMSGFSSYFGDKPMKVGETYKFDTVDPKTKSGARGTAKLVSLKDGKAEVQVSVDTIAPQMGDKPMHMDGTIWADTANGKMVKMQGKMKDLPMGGQGMTASSAEILIERKS